MWSTWVPVLVGDVAWLRMLTFFRYPGLVIMIQFTSTTGIFHSKLSNKNTFLNFVSIVQVVTVLAAA